MTILNSLVRGTISGIGKLSSSLWKSCLNVFNCAGVATSLAFFAVAIALASSSSWFDWAAQFIPVLGPAMLAVLKGALTCFIAFCAGFGFCRFNKEMVDGQAQVLAEKLEKEQEERHKEKEMIEKLQGENETLKTQCKEKEDEIGRLKNSSIAVASIKQILKCELVEADMKVREVFNEWITDSLQTSLLHRPTAKRFLGVIEKNFKTSLGIDLQRVRVRRIGNTLYISGVEDVEVNAQVPDKDEWVIEEVQEYKMRQAKEHEQSAIKDSKNIGYVPDESVKEIVTLKSPDEFHEIEKKYNGELIQRIKSPKFEQYDLAVKCAKKASRRLLEIILSPFGNAGYSIQFVNTDSMPDIPSESLPVFIEDFVVNGVKRIS